LQTVYVDAGYKEGVGGHISWFNKTTAKDSYNRIDCKDSFRCEYEAILKALGDHIEIVNSLTEIEFLIDNQIVQKQLNRQSAINDEETRRVALKIWEMIAGKKVRFQWIPREQNKAGKILGS
jgi:ribonuclease HI